MNTTVVLTPSQLSFTIREATGADDDILSLSGDESQTIHKYLSAMVLKGPDGGLMTPEDIAKLRLRDKYALLIESRIFSMGETLYFKYTWPNTKTPMEYEFNLKDFVWDYTQPLPEPHEETYFDQRITPYSVEFLDKTLTSGKKVRMSFLDGIGEAYLLKIAPNKRTANHELMARNLEVLSAEGLWQKVINFQAFSSREMAEIRGIYSEVDKPPMGIIEIQNDVTFEVMPVPVLSIQDFFYPTKV